MKTPRWIAPLFVIAALYDGFLGVLFLLAPQSPFQWFAVTPPNHFGYVQFPALLLIIFALMFLAVARNPLGNRNLIVYGILLKLAYCGVVFWYWIATGIPSLWKPFALLDTVMAVLFALAYFALGHEAQAGQKN